MKPETAVVSASVGVLLPDRLFQTLHRVLLVLATAAAIAFLCGSSRSASLSGVAFQVLATAATGCWLLARVPLQNVAVILALTIGGSAAVASALPRLASESISANAVQFGVMIFLLVVNSRALGEIVLLPMRQAKGYGWWLILLATIICIGIIPWWPPGDSLSALLPHSFAVALVPLLQLAIAPWLIDKRRIAVKMNLPQLSVWLCHAGMQLIPPLVADFNAVALSVLLLNALLISVAIRNGRQHPFLTAHQPAESDR
jgi:hypothetical protein